MPVPPEIDRNRIRIRGISRASSAFEFTYRGREIHAYPGETVAAALIAAGQWNFRETRSGSSRGLFCGMGVCGECTLLVDGDARRACLEPARPGADVQPRPALSLVAESSMESSSTLEHVDVDVLVVGAGPAGLAAAAAASAQGAEVLVIDERSSFGGQYFKQPAKDFNVDESLIDRQFKAGRTLYTEALTAGARFLFGASVWGAFGREDIAVIAVERRLRVHPRRLILAPGAYERPLTVPGWTLPGVITTGAAQTLLRAYSVTPGERVLLAGNGPLNLQVARELTRAGVKVVAVAELAPAPGPRLLPDLLQMALASPELIAEGVGHVLALGISGVPRLHSTVLVRCDADESGDRVARATLASVGRDGKPLPGTERVFEIDAVCMGYGFAPQSELPRAVGCRYDFDDARGTLRVIRDAEGRSSEPEVFVIGDAGGLGGARLAQAQGTIAGSAAATDLGHPPNRPQQRAVGDARRNASTHERFQRALWNVYGAPALTCELADANTLICRCEEVARCTLEACVSGDVRNPGSIKRLTRAGMGSCQARYCGLSIAAMSAAAGSPIGSDADWFAPRTPFKPVRIDELAAEAPPTVDPVNGVRPVDV